jgi:acyl dehydratase
MTDATAKTVDGPRFDDLAVGDVFDHAPAVTLTDGLAAAHHAIVGGRVRLAFDRELSRAVTGIDVASPPLVWDMAIGQSTLVTQRAIANLFYRGLRFVRFPAMGDTIATRTEIVGLRPVTPKPGRPPRGSSSCASGPSTRTNGRSSIFTAARCCPRGRRQARNSVKSIRRISTRRPARLQAASPAGTSAATAIARPDRISIRSGRACRSTSATATSSPARRSWRG